MGGPPPEGPRPARGGAATGPAPNGAAGKEVSVCEPAAGPGPRPGGQGPCSAREPGGREKAEIWTAHPARCLRALPWRKERNGGGGAGAGWGEGGKRGRGRATIWRVKTPARPCLP